MSVNSKMTALADGIRELSGTTTSKNIDAMTTDVNAANTEISEQMQLIAQISTALENKAAGDGGGSVETYSGTLSGSGIMPPASLYGTLWYTDASLMIQNVEISSLPYSFTVVKNSIIYWKDQSGISFKSGTNITQIYSTNMGPSNAHAAIVPTADNFDIKLGTS